MDSTTISSIAIADGVNRKRQRSENGEFAFPRATLMYKRPKVFAIRTFPDAFVFADGTNESKNVESMVDYDEEDPVSEDLEDTDQAVADPQDNAVYLENDRHSSNFEFPDNRQVVSLELPQSLSEAEFIRHGSPELLLENRAADSSSKTPPYRRTISCTRSFPPNCGGIYATNLEKVDNVETQVATRLETSVIMKKPLEGDMTKIPKKVQHESREVAGSKKRKDKVQTESEVDADEAVRKGEKVAYAINEDQTSSKPENHMVSSASKDGLMKKVVDYTSKMPQSPREAEFIRQGFFREKGRNTISCIRSFPANCGIYSTNLAKADSVETQVPTSVETQVTTSVEKSVLQVGCTSTKEQQACNKRSGKCSQRTNKLKAKGGVKKSKANDQCHHCGKEGHWKRNCKEYISQNSNKLKAKGGVKKSKANDPCYHCGKEGHWRRNCKEYLATV